MMVKDKLLLKAFQKVLKSTSNCISTAGYRTVAGNHKTFSYNDLTVHEASIGQRLPKPDPNHLTFGHHFSDHMLEIEWNSEKGWLHPKISPLHHLRLHPAAKVLHYAIELFEGMKAYRGIDNRIRIFRPDMNMKRMQTTAARACLPTFDGEEFIKCVMELLRIDQEWIPYSTSSSLYIRPTLIGTDPHLGIGMSHTALLYVITGPVGQYFISGLKPIRLLAEPRFVRAFPGGTGDKKLGCNYGPTILIGKIAVDHGCQQVLWLYGPDHLITEVGTMNIFLVIKNKNGERELITPPLEGGLILPGVTRQSILDLAREWDEFKVTERNIDMKEVLHLLKEGRLVEMFGAGTACIVSPVDRIRYSIDDTLQDLYIPTMDQDPCLMQRFYDAVTDIQYGRVARPDWTRIIDENTLYDDDGELIVAMS